MGKPTPDKHRLTDLSLKPELSISEKLIRAFIAFLRNAMNILRSQFQDVLDQHGLRLPDLAEVLERFLGGADERQMEKLHYVHVNNPIASMLERIRELTTENAELKEQASGAIYRKDLDEKGVADKIAAAIIKLHTDGIEYGNVVKHFLGDIERVLEQAIPLSDTLAANIARERADHYMPLTRLVDEARTVSQRMSESGTAPLALTEIQTMLDRCQGAIRSHEQFRIALQADLERLQKLNVKRSETVRHTMDGLSAVSKTTSQIRQWRMLLETANVDIETLAGVGVLELEEFYRQLDRRLVELKTTSLNVQALPACRCAIAIEELGRITTELNNHLIAVQNPKTLFGIDPKEPEQMKALIVCAYQIVTKNPASNGRSSGGLFQILTIAGVAESLQPLFEKTFDALREQGCLKVHMKVNKKELYKLTDKGQRCATTPLT